MKKDSTTKTRREFVAASAGAGALAAFGLNTEAVAIETGAILPEEERIKAFAALPEDGPVTMLNLLKFKPDGGQAAYMRYGMGVQPLLKKHGARPVFMAMAKFLLIGDDEWDIVAIVEYPSKKALRDMTESPEYQAIHHFREEGLERTVLYAMKQMPIGPTP